MYLRYDKRDNLGVLNSDWIRADVELDDRRIRSETHSATPTFSTAFDGQDELDDMDEEEIGFPRAERLSLNY